MECTIAALVACFSWSNLYVDTGLLVQDKGEIWVVDRVETFNNRPAGNGAIESGTNSSRQFIDTNKNPYGRLALGYEVTFDDFAGLGEVSLRVEAIHVSSVATTKDRGVNSLGLYARWRPFGR